MKSRVWFIPVMIVAMVVGCAEKFVLSGSPDVGGLLLVDPVVNTKSFLGQETQPQVVKVVVRKVIGDVLIEGEPLKDFFVFQGLKPGEYQLVSISTKPGKKEIVLNVPPENESQFSFHIAPGEPVYLGQITIQQDMALRDLGARYALNPAPEREKIAWKTLLQQSMRPQWKSIVEEKLSTGSTTNPQNQRERRPDPFGAG